MPTKNKKSHRATVRKYFNQRIIIDFNENPKRLIFKDNTNTISTTQTISIHFNNRLNTKKFLVHKISTFFSQYKKKFHEWLDDDVLGFYLGAFLIILFGSQIIKLVFDLRTTTFGFFM